MQKNNTMEILSYAKGNVASFQKGGVSSNEIRFFDYDGKKYVLKTALMLGDNLSPFWTMMKNVFLFTFEKQNEHLNNLYHILKDNPHIPVAAFVAADNEVMIYEYMQGDSWDEDEFPKGTDNAYQLGRYVGYNHQITYENCGIISVEDVTDFYSNVLFQIEECIKKHWNSDDSIDKKVKEYFEELKENRFVSSKYSLIMVDMCADQFLFDNETIVSCVDLDAYVIGPVEWELNFLKTQIEDWERFAEGYETYQNMPRFEDSSKLFFFLMALNAPWDKQKMEKILN